MEVSNDGRRQPRAEVAIEVLGVLFMSVTGVCAIMLRARGGYELDENHSL